MPIDTAAKRRSAGGVGYWVVGPGVTPNAARPQGWRQSSGWGYLGILAGAAPTPTGQVPRPSRYRGGHRVNYYHPSLWAAVWLSLGVFA